MGVARGLQCRVTHRNVGHLHSQQEEVNTKLIPHAAEATASGGFNHQHSLTRYRCLRSSNPAFLRVMQQHQLVTAVGIKRPVIFLGPICEAPVQNKAADFTGLSGADNTRGFAGRGKLSFWKIFRGARYDSNEISALISLGTMARSNGAISDGLVEFICKVNLPGTKTTKVKS